MVIGLIVALAVTTYFVIVGAVIKNFKAWRVRACKECSSTRLPNRCLSDHDTAAVFTAAFFPLTLPVVLGMALTPNYADPDRLSRSERRVEQRRARELAEAKHLRQLEIENGLR